MRLLNWCNILINDFEDIETKFSNVEKLDIDDLEALQIYNEYKGYYYLKRKNTKEGLEYLEKAKLMRFHEKTIAMIHYHMSFAYNYEWLRKTDAEYLLDAKNVFQKYYSLKRVSDCEMILGNYYSTFRNFQKASICYENRLRLLEVLGENKINQAKTISTIAYIYIQQKQYDKALKELDKAIVLNQKYIRIHLDYIWCYYKLGDINNANRWIVKMDHFQLDRELKMLWNLYEMIVAQYDKIPNDRLIEKAIKVYKYYKNQEDLDLSIFYIDIVIELLEKRKDYEKGFFYQKEKIFLLENV
ncbi:tetratricopeptide repeat protein [Faecalibacillus intestinalis]|uniref:tetratricopeptide repeat protein n=1 Tax=Faecalibacillus intestinalis TaxID=1982626 RepID=UPI003994B4C1